MLRELITDQGDQLIQLVLCPSPDSFLQSELLYRMLPHLVVLFLAIVKISTAQRSVESAFKSAGIVSDVIDRAPPPNGFLEVCNGIIR